MYLCRAGSNPTGDASKNYKLLKKLPMVPASVCTNSLKMMSMMIVMNNVIKTTFSLFILLLLLLLLLMMMMMMMMMILS